MPIPSVNVTIKDPALGLAASAERPLAKIGTASGGTANEVVYFSDPTVAKTTLVAGPLLEEVLRQLQIAGGPVPAVKVTASNSGAVGTIALTGTGPDPGFGTTGNPLDAYEILVAIVADGAVGTATFKISFDGGDTYSAVYATASTVTTFVAETGLTLTFAAGTYVAGDVYSASATAPTYSSSDLNSAFNALLADPTDIEGVHVIGTVGGANDAAKVTAFAALAAAVSTKLTAAETAGRYMYAILEAPDVADSAFNVSGVNNFADSRQYWCGGMVEAVMPSSGKLQKRNSGGAQAARIAAIDPHVMPGKVADGPLKGFTDSYRDERVTEALEARRINGLRTYLGKTGWFVTTGRTMAAVGSDFTFLPNRRVMDRACTIARLKLLDQINTDVNVDATTGYIAERDAQAIERSVQSELDAQLVARGFASAASCTLIRTDNVLSTNTLRAKVRVTPKAYASTIELEIGFNNPLLQVA